MHTHENKFFLTLMVVASLALCWILWPLYGAVLWGVVIAIIFAPVYRWMLRQMGNRKNLAALSTVAVILLMVILPLALIGAALGREATGVYKRIEGGELNLVQLFEQAMGALPNWVTELMNDYGITSLAEIQQRLAALLSQGSQFLATQALNIGASTFDFVVNLFVMLYLLFFLLRDGDRLSQKIRDAVPLRDRQLSALLEKFTVVIRATVKGNMVIALIQGTLGGLIFWFLGINAALLWAVVMAFLSLLPAVGAGLVWIPVALYLLGTGSIWQGVLLIGYGALVIGLVDNVLRPILVGKDTKLPDYVVLISTLGGIQAFGLNGFVIGPVIAAMFLAVWDIYTSSRQKAETAEIAG
jgi:predicted PurR-regulated permease PerM